MQESNFKIDFIGIGAPRCATTWIFECLKEHPEICCSSKKETGFFQSWNKTTFAEYKDLFDCESSDQIKGEFTPHYLYYEYAVNEIYNYFPDAKLIVSLRDPVERAFSVYRSHLYKQKRLSLYDTLRDAIKEDEELRAEGFYYQHLKKYFDKFPRKNIKIILYKNIKDKPEKTIQSIYNFLEVEDNYIPSFIGERENVTGVTKNDLKMPFLVDLMYKIRNKIKKKKVLYSFINNSFLLDSYKKVLRWNRIKKSSESKKTSLEDLPSKQKNEIRSLYKEGIEKLEKLINKDLSHWKQYDKKQS